MRDRLDKTLAAFLLLALALAVCIRGLSDPTTLEASKRTERLALPQVAKPMGVDLLAVHGSFRAGDAVRDAFRSEDRPGMLARPLVETDWEGDDDQDEEVTQVIELPQLRLSLVMTTSSVSRAIVDGSVVGIGDMTVAGSVQAISESYVEVLWGEQILRYGLQRTDPILINGRPVIMTKGAKRL